MAAELEDRIRESFRALRDEAPEAVGERLRAAAVPHLGRRRLPGLRRFLAPAVATAAVAAIAIVFFVVLTVSPPREQSSAPPLPERGVEVTLRVSARHAEPTAAQSAERLARLIRTRAAGYRVGDVDVRADGVGVTLVVPRTHDTAFATSLAQDLDVAVFDASRAIASGPDLERVIAAVEDRDGTAGPWRFYVVAPASLPGGYLSRPFASRGEALRERRNITGFPARVVAVPADIVLATVPRSRAPEFLALRDPLLGPGQIEAMQAGEDGLAVTVRPSARAVLEAGFTAYRPRRLVVIAGTDGESVDDPRYDASAGVLHLGMSRPSAGVFATRFPFGGVDARVDVVGVRVFGPPAPRRGERVIPLPPGLARLAAIAGPSRLRPLVGSFRRVVRARWRGEEWSLWTSRTADGRELVTILPPDPDAGAGTGGCPDIPVSSLYVCGAGGGAPGADLWRGRANEAVARIEAVYADGSRVAATVANGFFVIFLPREKRSPRRLVAYDRTGRRIASVRAGFGFG